MKWMKRLRRRLPALLLTIGVALSLGQGGGRAVLEGVYFTAANEQLLVLDDETMPFWSSEGLLYVSVTMFQGTDLDVFYVRNNTMGLAVLYTNQTDLRFDLVNHTCFTREGREYDAYAIERGGQVFVPVGLVCQYFGLNYTYTATGLVPLIRITSSSSMLDDISFIDAAFNQMESRYSRYKEERERLDQQEPVTEPPAPPPPVVVKAGQTLHLLISCEDPQAALGLMDELQSYQAQLTFLLTVEQMGDGDLLRGLIANGHSVALLAQGETEAEVETELEQARALLWQACCSWLGLVWYEGGEDLTALWQDMGCVPVTAAMDRRGSPLENEQRAQTLLSAIQRQGDDLSVYLGSDVSCAGGLPALLEGLAEDQYKVCGWRLGG